MQMGLKGAAGGIGWSAWWEKGIRLGMNAVVILHPWPRKTTTRRNKAVDPTLWALMPSDFEGCKLREELQLAIRKVVMDPPGHCPPVGTISIPVGKPRYDHCR
jgi:hypothetical protein